MSGRQRQALARVVGAFLLVVGLGLVWRPAEAPIGVFVGLATAAYPLAEAWRGARGTALRGAVLWGALALAIGLLAQALASVEPPGTGRPWAGHLTYLSVLATLAALITVLNARTPGEGAWAILMGLLVLVFLIPWLEGPGLARDARGLGRLRLDAPWSVFYVVVVAAGVTNYLPTRFGPAAGWLALGFGVEYVALTRGTARPGHWGVLASFFPWTLSVALWTAYGRSGRRAASGSGLEAAWLWFRDHWGVVWALRTRDRFNRSAESQGWRVRLEWDGVVPAPGSAPGSEPVIPDAAGPTFRGLLRRFADPARVAEAVEGATTAPCQPRGVG